jgi:type II secretory pathway pseudopilin PulG
MAMSEKSISRSDHPAIVKVRCSGCGVVYTIKQEAIASYPAAFRCKKCGQRLRVDAPPAPANADPVGEPGPPSANPAAESASPAAPAPPPGNRGGGHRWVWWAGAALSLIGILAAIAIPQFFAYRSRGFDAQARAAVQRVQNAQQVFFLKNHHYAGSIKQLQDAGPDPLEKPGVVVSLLGSGPTEFYVEGFHARGSNRFAACADGDALAVLPDKTREISGPNKAYKLTVPDDWRKVSDLNDTAEVQIAQPRNDCYLIVITEKQDDLQVEDLEAYSVLVRSSIMDNLLQAKARKTGLDNINHRAVLQYEILGTLPDSRVPVVYLHTVVQGRRNYYQVVAWTTDQNYKANQSAIRSIVGHFQEI